MLHAQFIKLQYYIDMHLKVKYVWKSERFEGFYILKFNSNADNLYFLVQTQWKCIKNVKT